MAQNWEAPLADRVPDHDLPDAFDFGVLTSSEESRKGWVVKLQFSKDGRNGVGTGFFLNIPGASRDVILTAGHNLLRSQDMKILIPDNGQNFISVPESDLRISDDYRRDDKDTVHDYGAILLPRKDRHGFGFSLQLAFMKPGQDIKVFDRVTRWKYLKARDNVYITGYRPTNPPGSPVQHDGMLFLDKTERQMEDQLEYKLDTEEGLSGSAVWMAYKGHEMVIGIHNHGPRRAGRGSRATRLNEKVLDQIFAWAGVSLISKRLKVSHPEAHPDGCFLQFCEDDPEAWIGIGPDSPESRFDVLPAYVGPTSSIDGLQLQYAFMYRDSHHPGERRWVRWNVNGDRAELTNELTSMCLVSLRPKPVPGPFKIVVQRDKEKITTGPKKKASGLDKVLLEVKVDTSEITEEDIKRGDAQIQNFMSFNTYSKSKTTQFNRFCLE